MVVNLAIIADVDLFVNRLPGSLNEGVLRESIADLVSAMSLGKRLAVTSVMRDNLKPCYRQSSIECS